MRNGSRRPFLGDCKVIADTIANRPPASAGRRGAREGPRWASLRQLDARRPCGHGRPSLRRQVDGVGQGLLQLGVHSSSGSCFHCTTSPRRSGVPDPFSWRTLRRNPSPKESFEFIRLIARSIGRCAKFAGIAATQPDIVDVPGAPDSGRAAREAEFTGLRFAYRAGAPPVRGASDLRIEPGEHVGLVGPSGSGKTTLTKLMLRFADRDGGLIEIDGQWTSKWRHAVLVAAAISPNLLTPRCSTAPSPRTSVTAG